MEEFLHILRKSPLFYGVNDDELYTLLKCCAAEQTRYEEGEYIYRMGESLNSIMIMLSGSAMVVQENFWGRQEELFRVKEGEIFGESYSCARTAVLPVSVVTEGPCEVLFLQYQRMITTRDKLLSYLSQQAVACGGRDFDIPHSRQELARYLGVDRSAMSNELSKMKTEGLLEFQRNHFVLYEKAGAVNGQT